MNADLETLLLRVEALDEEARALLPQMARMLRQVQELCQAVEAQRESGTLTQHELLRLEGEKSLVADLRSALTPDADRDGGR